MMKHGSQGGKANLGWFVVENVTGLQQPLPFGLYQVFDRYSRINIPSTRTNSTENRFVSYQKGIVSDLIWSRGNNKEKRGEEARQCLVKREVHHGITIRYKLR